jgi:hypothetical protein
MKKENKKSSLVWGLLKTPYYVGKGIYLAGKKVESKVRQTKLNKKRKLLVPKYEGLKVVKEINGEFEGWENQLIGEESKIGIILGARGTGKTAFGVKLMENVYAKSGAKCYAMGFKQEEMPLWIEVVDDVSKIKNNATVLIDEGGILFSSRKSMTAPNKLLSDLILVARHKNLNILFISQNSSNLDVNIIRQADFLVLKPTSLLQKDFERKKIRDIYQGVQKDFEKLQGDKGLSYIYANEFQGFVSNPLPSFWSMGISKSFR